jgi:hypothetical protein
MKKDKIIEFLLDALLAAVGAIMIGLIFFGRGIFNSNRVGYQFLSFGIIGGFLFSSFRFLKLWMAAIIFVVLLVLNEVALHLGNWDFIWQDVLYFVAMASSVFFFARYYMPKLAGTILSRLFAISSLFAIGFTLVTIIFYFIFAANPNIPRFNLAQMIYYDLAQGFLVGFGLGAGVEGAEYVVKRTMKSGAQS